MLRSSTLLELRASQCRLGDNAMVLLCLHLRAARNLSLLDVSLNCFQGRGSDALALLIRTSGTLCQLDISGNQLTASPMLSLCTLTEAIGALILCPATKPAACRHTPNCMFTSISTHIHTQ